MFTAALSDKLNDTYVDFDFAFKHCENLRARLPVLDSLETISVVKKYLEEFNFTTLEVIIYLKDSFFENGAMATPTKLRNPTVLGLGVPASTQWSHTSRFCH